MVYQGALMLTYLLQGLSLGLSAAASPGPFQAFIIGKAVRNGWRPTLPAVLAPLISDGPIIALMVLLLTRMPAGVLRGIQIAGALYVLYLAWRSYQAWRWRLSGSTSCGKGSRRDCRKQIVLDRRQMTDYRWTMPRLAHWDESTGQRSALWDSFDRMASLRSMSAALARERQ